MWSFKMAPSLNLMQGKAFFNHGRFSVFGAKSQQYRMSLCARDEAHSMAQLSAAESSALPQQSPYTPSLLCTVGSQPLQPPSIRQWHLTDQHLLALTVIACLTGSAVATLFIVAIPTMLALKNAAESLERLLDVTRQELPGTMAAVRLSGMEISDLTLELNELGQEITERVRSSARAVRAAEDGIRRMSHLASRGAHNSSRSSYTSSDNCYKESSSEGNRSA